MAAAATPPVATTPTEDAPPAPKLGRKKLILIAGATLLGLTFIGGGGAAYFVMKKRAAEAASAAASEGGEPVAEVRKEKPAPSGPPTFLPLDAFVVNLADRDVDRFAQVGITLEVIDAKAADQLKLYMPAVRDGVLMILAHKNSAELLERAGKEKLAREVLQAALDPLQLDDKAEPPVRKVHFSSFIIQ